MSSRRFRSQPLLDRGGIGVPAWAVVLMCGAVVWSGATMMSMILPPPVSVSTAPTPVKTVFVNTVVAPKAAPTPSAPAPVVVAAAAPRAAPATASLAPRTLASTAPAPPAVRAIPVKAMVSQAKPDEAVPSVPDYVSARNAYDAHERAEGYRWAAQYRVARSSYCQIAARRTSAFVQGCLDYLKS